MASGGAYIYHGFWINWSHGRVLGSTITLSNRDGSFLTAFLALFVAVAGSQLWRILSFTLHQARASRDSRDGLHHQQQAILRNTGSAIGAAYEFTRLVIPWWKHTTHSFWRSLPLVLLALLNLAFFGAAGILSAEVTRAAGNETLIMSPNCGSWDIQSDNITGSVAGFQSKVLNDTITAANYARACYGNTGNVLQCNSYTKQQIPWKTNVNATCPFKSGTCIGTNTAAYEMDTGPIDSHEMLGINAPQRDRITYRKVTTCAPIHTAGFVQLENYTAENGKGVPGDQFQRFYYGPFRNGSNETYFYNTHAYIDNFGYDLSLTQWIGGSNTSSNSWRPIAALNRTDADITLLFLEQNSITYQAPCDDPMFSAHDAYNISSTVFYRSDRFVNVMGCIDQHQYCNPNALGQDNACTELSSSGGAGFAISLLRANDIQILTASRLAVEISSLTTYGSINGRGASALRASETVYNKDQAPLPNNQWQIESSSWFATSLAKLQRIAVEYATGPDFLPEGAIVQKPPGSIWRAMCRTQKVRDTGANTSFNVLGVVLIIALGGLIILTNMILQPVVGWIQKRANRGDHCRLQWALDEKLQLQRVAYEEAGIGKWQGLMDSVPVTARGEAFGLAAGGDGKIDPRRGVVHARSESSSGKFENDGLLEEEKGIRGQTREIEIEGPHLHSS
ncbi:MAG: hypothetical protein M1836_002897 [Candelina mexicana]|nr:MAG: hypothetical protein M1836_002897 [Candelina mexicana]